MNDTRFESCIKCTVCTTTCPVSRVNPRYPGPKQAGPDGERLRLKDGALYDEALKYCINCKRCEVACPSDVKIGDIIQRARAQYGQQKPTLRDAILSHTDLMGTLSTPFAPLVNAATGLKPVRRLLDATLNIDHRRTLPKYGFGTFRRAYRRLGVGFAKGTHVQQRLQRVGHGESRRSRVKPRRFKPPPASGRPGFPRTKFFHPCPASKNRLPP